MPAGIRVNVNQQSSASMVNASHSAFTTTPKSHNPSLNYHNTLLSLSLFRLFSPYSAEDASSQHFEPSELLPSLRLNVTRIEILHTGALLSMCVCVCVRVCVCVSVCVCVCKEGLRAPGGVRDCQSVGVLISPWLCPSRPPCCEALCGEVTVLQDC